MKPQCATPSKQIFPIRAYSAAGKIHLQYTSFNTAHTKFHHSHTLLYNIIYYFRFHFAKNIFAKIKGKFRLGAFLKPRECRKQAEISNKLRQYMALPLLKPEDMRGQLERLEAELEQLSAENCTLDIVDRFNDFHNYVTTYWMKQHGPYNISVHGTKHKTNNIAER